MNWQILKIEGETENVKKQLAEKKDLPQAVKDFLASELVSMPKGIVAVRATGYSADHSQGSSFSRHIQISISGIKF